MSTLCTLLWTVAHFEEQCSRYLKKSHLYKQLSIKGIIIAKMLIFHRLLAVGSNNWSSKTCGFSISICCNQNKQDTLLEELSWRCSLASRVILWTLVFDYNKVFTILIVDITKLYESLTKNYTVSVNSYSLLYGTKTKWR